MKEAGGILQILICSEFFWPSVGGIEIVTELLAEALAREGHKITVATNQPGAISSAYPFRLIRRPRLRQLMRLHQSTDAVILQGPNIRLGWPLFWKRLPAVIVHHMPSSAREQTMLHRKLRATLARQARHASVSHWLARVLPWPIETVLPNPYNNLVFKREVNVSVKRDIIFAGRLIPEKGASVLLESVSLLKKSGLSITVTVAGDGSDRARLEKMVAVHNLGRQVTFTREVTPAALADLFKGHRVAAVPSLQSEGFGMVALEALACGCRVVVSAAGALPEAVGRCGLTVPAGDAVSLATALRNALSDASETSEIEQHLAKHHPDSVAKNYLKLFNQLRSGASKACDS